MVSFAFDNNLLPLEISIYLKVLKGVRGERIINDYSLY